MKPIFRDDTIFKSNKFLKDAVGFSIIISLIEESKKYPDVVCYSDGSDCIIVNSDSKNPVCVWTSDNFTDFENLYQFIQTRFHHNNPLTITSKKIFKILYNLKIC